VNFATNGGSLKTKNFDPLEEKRVL
jgi:hypothetical protein